MARTLITAALLAIFAGAPSYFISAQTRNSAPEAAGDLKTLRTQLQRRFDLLPIANGVVLKPRFTTSVRSIEVTSAAIAVDGTPVTGPELRQKLGNDADLIFQLSYLDEASRRTLLGLSETAATTDQAANQPTNQTNQTNQKAAPEIAPDIARPKKRDALVRVGGSVSIAQDEHVTDDVVVVGGSADVDGQVDGEVVVIGGSLTLGPHANIRRDVTVVGGTLSKDPNAIVSGKVAEVGMGGVPFGPGVFRRGAQYGWPGYTVRPVVRFGGTIVRVVLLMLLSALVLLLGRPYVEQIAERAAAEPVKSWLVGFLAEIVFVPMLVLTVVVLAISIIGIPLLLLVPVAIVAAAVVALVGFAGIAYHIGGLLQDHFEQLRARPYAAMLAGIIIIVSPLLLARLVGLTGQLGIIVGLLVVVGTIAEYLAWTTGLGAAALARFGRPRPLPAAAPMPTPNTPVTGAEG
jgi:ribosomal protein L18E